MKILAVYLKYLYYKSKFLFTIKNNKKQKHSKEIEFLSYAIEAMQNEKKNILDKLKSNNKKMILIVGKSSFSDSLAISTYSFFNAINLKDNNLFFYAEVEKGLFYISAHDKKTCIKTIDINKLDARIFDIMIYTSPLTHSYLSSKKWTEDDYASSILPAKKPLLSGAWCCWDGSIAHPKWVEIINNHFDFAMAPMQHLKEAFISSGVIKPVFVLQTSISFKKFIDYKKEFHQENKPFVFGWNGTLEERKNPFKVVNAFIKAFGDNHNVNLRLHTRYMVTGKNNKLYQDYLKLVHSQKNIIFTNKCLSVEENENLLKSYDAYIYPSMAEGFSVTPREALATGEIVVLSDIKTHKTITDLGPEDGVFWLKANKPKPITQLDLELGYQYDIEEEDLVATLKEVYKNKDKLYADELVEKRKNAAYLFDSSILSPLYSSIACPKKVSLGDDNIIKNDEIIVNDINLKNKYETYIKGEK